MSMGEVVAGIIVIVVLFWAMFQVFYILDFFKRCFVASVAIILAICIIVGMMR